MSGPDAFVSTYDEVTRVRVEDPGRFARLAAARSRRTVADTDGSVLYRLSRPGRAVLLPGEESVTVPLAVLPGNRCDEHAIGQATAPYDAGSYPNFVEEPEENVAGFYDGETWARLRHVKGVHDAGDMFRGNHHVPPVPPALPVSPATRSSPSRRPARDRDASA